MLLPLSKRQTVFKHQFCRERKYKAKPTKGVHFYLRTLPSTKEKICKYGPSVNKWKYLGGLEINDAENSK